MSKAKKKGDELVRKIASRTETIETTLTQIEIEDQRQKFIELCGDRDQAKEDEKARVAEHKSGLAKLSAMIASTLGLIRSGRTKKEVPIEEWVTKQNEVVRINADTREEIGPRRTATARELQEELPLKNPPEADEDPNEGDDGEKTASAEADADFGNETETVQ